MEILGFKLQQNFLMEHRGYQVSCTAAIEGSNAGSRRRSYLREPARSPLGKISEVVPKRPIDWHFKLTV
jgi:hypothetical protein